MSMTNTMAAMQQSWSRARQTAKQRLLRLNLKGIYAGRLQAFSRVFTFSSVPLSESIDALLVHLQVQMANSGFIFEAPHSPEAPAFQLLFIRAHGGLIRSCEIGASRQMQEFKRKYAANETVGKLLLKTPHFSSAGFNKGLADSYLLHVSKLFSALATDYY